MPLFRRGSQLLRLGNALRDCCCRPENPPQCFLPDMCRYYWEVGDYITLPANTYATRCSPLYFPGQVNRYVDSLPFGIVADTGLNEYNFSVGPSDFFYVPETGEYTRSMLIRISHRATGRTNEVDYVREVYPSSGSVMGARYTTDLFINALWLLKQKKIRIEAEFEQQVFVGPFPESEKAGFRRVHGRFLATPQPSEVEGVCIQNPNWFCLPGQSFPRLHLGEDVVIDLEIAGITVNGSFNGFTNSRFPDVDFGPPVWHHEDKYPFTQTVPFTLKGFGSCRSGDCDCEVDLTGRTVVFEGQTFTYGSLQQFTSDDGLTIWEEGPSAGTFIRDDRRPCDGTVSMRIRKAEVSCSAFDGVPRWFVLLDSECYEREGGGCAPTVTASKITLYNGAFSCDSEGYPLGAAHSFTEDTDPPDLDQENISGTPSANCDVENPIPSISFS